MSTKLSVDIGGTFTDVVLQHAGQLTATKVLTTYDDPANAVLEGTRDVLQKAGVTGAEVTLVLHGTTLATNALIERRGARTALLTTAGHRDVLEMALENRFEQYDVNIHRPQPLVPRYLRLPIDERIAADGEVLRELDEETVASAIEVLRAERVESVAVGFLHGYANSDHEARVRSQLLTALPDLAVTLASEVCPEVREYERFSTAVANAYVQPLMATYLDSLRSQLAAFGVAAPILLMSSGGGLTTLDAAKSFPIRLVESGPAGGAALAAALAKRSAWPRVLSFDMGGTTAKICLIDDGEPQLSRSFEVDRVYRFKKGSGLPVRIPVVEMVEIGAGGGSLAHVDRLGRVAVGPESAGSEPGPAAYGLGGVNASVTDADVVLGKLSPEHFAGGRISLDLSLAEQAVQSSVGSALGTDAVDAAYAICETVDENMALASRAHAAEWGKSFEERTLIAFGGAAPLHAARLAKKLKLSRVVVPAFAGVGSAVGFLLAAVSFEVVRSDHVLLKNLDVTRLGSLLQQMRDEAMAVVAPAVGDLSVEDTARAYMRYVGQGFEISVVLPSFDDVDRFGDQLREQFEAQYQALYGRTIPNQPIEILSWTLGVSTGSVPADIRYGSVRSHTQDVREIQMVEEGSRVAARLVHREALVEGEKLSGPALIVEDQTTIVVPTGFDAQLDEFGQVLLEERA